MEAALKKYGNRLIAMTLLCGSWLMAASCTPAQNEQELFQNDAEQGDADTPDSLGRRYDDGEAAIEDDREAMRWFRTAAEQGDARAQFNLGTMYDNGEGVIEDDAEAARWYRMAAEQGHASAQFNLGVMYDNGLGIIEDDVFAHMWFNMASANGRVSIAGVGPEESRANLEREMTSAQISRATELARACVASDYQNCGP